MSFGNDKRNAHTRYLGAFTLLISSKGKQKYVIVCVCQRGYKYNVLQDLFDRERGRNLHLGVKRLVHSFYLKQKQK